VAAAVTARLPHPSTRAGEAADAPRAAAVVPPRSDHHDVLLRRLRELGDLHHDGVLTDEEFARTKAAVLRGF
ncbi:SHOCT domain-containing protein, partial [Streptomyces anthocyanicus]